MRRKDAQLDVGEEMGVVGVDDDPLLFVARPVND
jgi:hypothetical protein